jgi:hypothetical protein
VLIIDRVSVYHSVQVYFEEKDAEERKKSRALLYQYCRKYGIDRHELSKASTIYHTSNRFTIRNLLRKLRKLGLEFDHDVWDSQSDFLDEIGFRAGTLSASDEVELAQFTKTLFEEYFSVAEKLFMGGGINIDDAETIAINNQLLEEVVLDISKEFGKTVRDSKGRSKKIIEKVLGTKLGSEWKM